MSDINSDLVAQEVDDEVRRERMHLLWKAYGKYVIGAAIGVVLVVAGREIYNWRVNSVESAHSVAFEAALEASNAGGVDAVTIWRDALPELGDSYGALARLRIAAAMIEKGDIDGALATFDALSTETDADVAIRELATLKAGMLLAGQKRDLNAAKSKLSTIAIKGKTWYFSAEEQLALIDLQQGETDAALMKFTRLADDAETPQSIKARATQFRNFIETQQFAAESAETETSVDEGEGQ